MLLPISKSRDSRWLIPPLLALEGLRYMYGALPLWKRTICALSSVSVDRHIDSVIKLAAATLRDDGRWDSWARDTKEARSQA